MGIPLVYRRSGLLGAGYTDRELRQMLRSGGMNPVRRGSYVAAPIPEDARVRHRLLVRAAYGDLGHGAVISHVSAAVLHGLAVWAVRIDRVQVTKVRRSGGRRHRLVHVRTAPLAASEIVDIDGMAATSIARTIVDLARTSSFASAVVTADAALATGMVEPRELMAVARRQRRWPGIPAARRVIGFADPA